MAASPPLPTSLHQAPCPVLLLTYQPESHHYKNLKIQELPPYAFPNRRGGKSDEFVGSRHELLGTQKPLEGGRDSLLLPTRPAARKEQEASSHKISAWQLVNLLQFWTCNRTWTEMIGTDFQLRHRSCVYFWLLYSRVSAAVMSSMK